MSKAEYRAAANGAEAAAEAARTRAEAAEKVAWAEEKAPWAKAAGVGVAARADAIAAWAVEAAEATAEAAGGGAMIGEADFMCCGTGSSPGPLYPVGEYYRLCSVDYRETMHDSIVFLFRLTEGRTAKFEDYLRDALCRPFVRSLEGQFPSYVVRQRSE